MVVGASRFQRLMTPLRVPIASGGNGLASAAPSSLSSSALALPDVCCSMAIAVITRSPRIGSMDSVMPISSSAWTPPFSDNVAEAGSAGKSTTCASTRRPADVTSPYVARVEVSKIVVI